MNMLIYGLLTGIGFGFLLQKARVVRYDKQIGAQVSGTFGLGLRSRSASEGREALIGLPAWNLNQ